MMSVRTNLGGFKHSPARYSAVRSADLIPFPSGSIARRAPLESSQLRNAALDVIKVAAAFLFILVTGLACLASLFMCFFCRF
jgi:hypothetical protein